MSNINLNKQICINVTKLEREISNKRLISFYQDSDIVFTRLKIYKTIKYQTKNLRYEYNDVNS